MATRRCGMRLATCLACGLFVACGQGPRGTDLATSIDLVYKRDAAVDVADSGVCDCCDTGPLDLLLDWVPDLQKDVSGEGPGADTAVDLDVAEADSGLADDSYHLAAAEVPKGAHVTILHPTYLGEKPSQSRLMAVPYGASLLADGQTLRVGVAWFNGYGAVVKVGELRPLGWDPIHCQEVQDGLLPSGLVYYDVDTVTDNVTFVGEVVFSPSSAEIMRWNWTLAVELFGDLSQTGALSPCASTLDGFGMCAAAGHKEYFFPMCRHFSELDANDGMGPADCQDYPLLCGRGCNEHAKSAFPTDPSEVGYVDIMAQELHLLVVRDMGTSIEKVIPLSLAGSQITRTQALRSACVQEAGSLPELGHGCIPEAPYYFLYRAHPDDPLVTDCHCIMGESAYSSLEEYLADPVACDDLASLNGDGVASAFFDPYGSEDGAFLSVDYWGIAVWDAASEGVVVQSSSQIGPDGATGAWTPPSNFYFAAGPTPFRVATAAHRYVWADGGTAEVGPMCFYWKTSLLQGSKATSSFSVEELGGKKVFSCMTLWESTMTVDEAMAAYGFSQNDKEACSFTTYQAVPLYD